MALSIKAQDDTLKKDLTAGLRVECGRLTETLLDDALPSSRIGEHLSRGVSTCLFAPSKSTLRRLGKSDYRARPAVLFATLERNQKRSRLACPRSMFDYPRYRSLGCSRTPGSCDDEMSANARDIYHKRDTFIYIFHIVKNA